MSLLDLKLPLMAWKFVYYDFLFVTHPIGNTRESDMIAAFNEAAALSSESWHTDLHSRACR